MTFFYLASPYSSHEDSLREARYEAAEVCTSWMLRHGIWTYSPIVHCHKLANRHDLPKDASFWSEYNHAMLRASQGLFILTIPGWRDSIGVCDERAEAESLRLAEYLIEPLSDGSFLIDAVRSRLDEEKLYA